MTSACHQGDFDTLGVSAPESLKVCCGDLEVRVEQGAVNVDRDEPNCHVWIVNRRQRESYGPNCSNQKFRDLTEVVIYYGALTCSASAIFRTDLVSC